MGAATAFPAGPPTSVSGTAFSLLQKHWPPPGHAQLLLQPQSAGEGGQVWPQLSSWCSHCSTPKQEMPTVLNPIPCARDPPVLGGCSQDSGPGAQIPSCPAATGWMEGRCLGAGTRLFGPLNPSRQLQLLGQPGLRVWDPRLRAGAAAAAQEPRAVLEELPEGTCGATSERRERGRQRILPCSRGLRCTTLIPPSPPSLPGAFGSGCPRP